MIHVCADCEIRQAEEEAGQPASHGVWSPVLYSESVSYQTETDPVHDPAVRLRDSVVIQIYI